MATQNHLGGRRPVPSVAPTLSPDTRAVFRGLADGGLSGKDIAAHLEVAPSTVSKWRRGQLAPSAAVVQFLTLLLADIIRGKERSLDAMSDAPLAWRLGRESELAAMRQFLAQQEQINGILPGISVRDGARLFKAWLEKSGAVPAAPLPPKHQRLSA